MNGKRHATGVTASLISEQILLMSAGHWLQSLRYVQVQLFDPDAGDVR